MEKEFLNYQGYVMTRFKLPIAVHVFLLHAGCILLIQRQNTGFEDTMVYPQVTLNLVSQSRRRPFANAVKRSVLSLSQATCALLVSLTTPPQQATELTSSLPLPSGAVYQLPARNVAL